MCIKSIICGLHQGFKDALGITKTAEYDVTITKSDIKTAHNVALDWHAVSRDFHAKFDDKTKVK